MKNKKIRINTVKNFLIDCNLSKFILLNIIFVSLIFLIGCENTELKSTFEPKCDVMAENMNLISENQYSCTAVEINEIKNKLENYENIRNNIEKYGCECTGIFNAKEYFPIMKGAQLDKVGTLTKEFCSKLGRENQVEYCYSNLVRDTGDITICNLIQDDKYKRICYGYGAVKNNDVSICNNIKDKDDKTVCTVFFAIATRNDPICDKVKDGYKKKECHSGVNFMIKNQNRDAVEYASSILKSGRI